MIIKNISLFIGSFVLCLTLLVGVCVFAFPDRTNELSQNTTRALKNTAQWASDTASNISTTSVNSVSTSVDTITQKVNDTYTASLGGVNHVFNSASIAISTTKNSIIFILGSLGSELSQGTAYFQTSVSDATSYILNILAHIGDAFSNKIEGTKIVAAQVKNSVVSRLAFSDTNENNNDYVQVASLEDAMIMADIEPSAGRETIDDEPPQIEYAFETQQETIVSEVVLVPREKTVISSSRDGKIKTINFANGDTFNKGDILLEYECKDIRAEIDAAGFEQKLAGQKMLTTSRLYDLNIASKIDREQASVEKNVARAKQSIAQSKLDACIIRAQFDGRVVKRLANPNEYTRTDRVLMEIASTGTLDAEFLMPSIWLRWINIDAPITLVISETDREYTGAISRIYGEVDPVSQSIQIRATLNDYKAPLLPGMSGQVSIDVNAVRDAGIRGFLETIN